MCAAFYGIKSDGVTVFAEINGRFGSNEQCDAVFTMTMTDAGNAVVVTVQGNKAISKR